MNMKKYRRLNLLAAIFNSAVLVFVTGVFIVNMINGRALDNFFRFYTNSSNVLSAISCAILIPFNIRAYRNGSAIPKWTYILKYIAASAVLLTFVTVAVILAPAAGIQKMYLGYGFFTHLICPILVTVSFVFFETCEKLRFRTAATAAAPTVFYAILYYINVAVITEENGGWPDMYGFVYGNVPPAVSFPGMIGMGFFLCVVLWALKNAVTKYRSK